MYKIQKIFLILSLLFLTIRTAEFSIPCQSDAECEFHLTSNYECIKNVCLNTQMQKLTLTNLFGMTIIFIVSGIAISAGIGGGAIFTSVFIGIHRFDSGDAIVLSQISIFSSAVMGALIIMDNRMPNQQNQFIVNYDVIAQLMPTVAGGSILGVILNKFIPSIFILAALCYILVDLMLKIYVKAKSENEKEANQEVQEQLMSDAEKKIEEFEMNLTPKKLQEIPNQMFLKNKSQKMTGNNNKMNAFTKKEIDQTSNLNMAIFGEETPEQRIPFSVLIKSKKRHLIIIFMSVFFVVFSSLLRGGKGMNSIIGIESCSIASFIILLLSLVGCYFVEEILIQVKFIEAENHGIDNWKLTGFFSGAFGSVLGLGGGVILNPILLKHGFYVQEAFAISGIIVLFNSMISAFQFLIVGAFTIENSLIVLIVTGFGGFGGAYLIKKIVDKYKKSAFLLWILFYLILCSALLQPITGVQKLIKNPAACFKFGSIC